VKNLKRKQRGNAIALGVVLALVLVTIGVGFVMLTMYIGGSAEVKNAVDSGALNVGKQSLDEVYVEIDEQNPYYDVTNDGDPTKNDGKINLRRINRVWAKAMLIAANSDAAKKDKYATNDGNDPSGMDSSAEQARAAAEKISNDLSDKLNDAANLQTFFTNFAQDNSARMLGMGTKVKVDPGNTWKTSAMDRGDESNIVLSGNIFPPEWSSAAADTYSLPDGYTMKTTRNVTANSEDGKPYTFLKGYDNLSVGDRTYYQVAFQFEQKPHLVSKSLFDRDTPQKLPVGTWDNPVPNAFSVKGSAVNTKSNIGESAMSWVETNPHQLFAMSMPHSFLHIKLDEMKAHYYFFAPIPSFPSLPESDPNNPPKKEDTPDFEKAIGTIEDAMKVVNSLATEFGSPDTYGYTPTSVSGSTMPFGGILCMSVTSGSVEVGVDVVGSSLDAVIFGPPPGGIPDSVQSKLPKGMQLSASSMSPGTQLLELYMTNRINQMISKPGLTLTPSDLHSAMGGGDSPTPEGLATMLELPGGSDSGQDYYLYSPDGEHIRVASKDVAKSDPQAPWLADMIDKEADGGSDAHIVKDDQCPAPYWFFPTASPAPFCGPLFFGGWESWDKDLFWTPGSGYNGSLGTVRVKRWTNVYSLYICGFLS